jgi:type IV fimbrial biogenesis protein FimT
MPMMGRRERRAAKARGFSLVELMVAIAVLAISIGLATPSFTLLVNSNRLTSHSNELVASIQLARSEAIRRNARVAVCGSSDGSSCDASATSWEQWLVVLVSSSEVLRANQVKNSVQVMPSAAIAGNANRIVFYPDGLARDASNALLAASVGVCLPVARPEQNTRVVSVAGGSRVRTVSENTSAACEAPDDE